MPQFENHAFNPFFSNIRQNMELAHGPIRERFTVRLPQECDINPETGLIKAKNPRCLDGESYMDSKGYFVVPKWLRQTVVNDEGPTLLAEMYEVNFFVGICIKERYH